MSLPHPEPVVADAAGVQQPAFVPRVFPPPALAAVPLAYIIDKLHQLGPQYWQKLPHTGDCTLVIPAADNRRRSQGPSFMQGAASAAPTSPLSSGPFAPSYSSDGRRSSMPNMGSLRRRLTLRLHQDYLCAQSTFLRALFSGASPLDLTSASRFVQSGPECAPRLLPSPPGHPIVLLPLPDPSSFPYLLHYLYMGDTSILDRALTAGRVRWEGVARNAEYLGLRAELKVFLGRWFARWVRDQERLRIDEEPEDDMEDDDDDESLVDEEETTMWDDESSPSDDGMAKPGPTDVSISAVLAQQLEVHALCASLPPLVIPA